MRGNRLGRGARARVGRLVLPLLAVLGLGCGQKYELPPQPPPALPPPPGYSKYAVWNMGSVTPLGISGYGGLVYVAEETGPAAGRVRVYQAGVTAPQPSPYASPFEGLTHPRYVAAVKQQDSVFVMVADADTIKRYPELGGGYVFRFSEPDWQGDIAGLAVDQDLNVYVSFRNKIVAYDSRGRFNHLVADDRSGSGQVRQPLGLQCVGEELLVADGRTGLVVRLHAGGTNQFSTQAIDTPQMSGTSDVACDPQGRYIYAADHGNRRILKFDYSTGALVDSVYSPSKVISRGLPDSTLCRDPRFVAEGDPYVYVSDVNNRRVVVFRYSNQ